MFVKGDPAEEGFRECFAEGKHYGIKPVSEYTFSPDEDSFHKMHHHGVAFESEQMAYRIYFDNRQTVDVYAKRTPQLELAASLWYPNDSLLTCGYGDDVLKVGNSIGVGSVRPYDYSGGKLQKMTKAENRTQRIAELTDKKAVVEVEVRGLQIEDTVTDLLTRYTLLAGHRDVRCEVFTTAPLQTLVTGVQRVGGGNMSVLEDTLSSNKQFTLASWGTDWPVNDTIKYPKETIGLAVRMMPLYAGRAFCDSLQLLLPLQLQPDANGHYYAMFYLTAVSQKENTPPARTWEDFLRYLRKWQPDF